MTFTTLTPVAARPEIPAGPPKLNPRQLRTAQAETLDAPRLRYSLLARALFKSMDLAYGRTRTIVKFTMLEFIARVPYQAWELFVLRPEWSYRLNADFEDHAEHEYMAYVADHPELETQPDPGSYAAQYGQYGSLADLLRQIGHDERTHKEGSLINMHAPRFHDSL